MSLRPRNTTSISWRLLWPSQRKNTLDCQKDTTLFNEKIPRKRNTMDGARR
jgi:hypothetical protein